MSTTTVTIRALYTSRRLRRGWARAELARELLTKVALALGVVRSAVVAMVAEVVSPARGCHRHAVLTVRVYYLAHGGL